MYDTNIRRIRDKFPQSKIILRGPELRHDAIVHHEVIVNVMEEYGQPIRSSEMLLRIVQ